MHRRPGTAVHLPFVGTVNAQALSLPLLTLVLAGMDAFNPCAFFVLLFLLSLLVHAKSRTRMMIVGGTFVLFSGIVYFIFMAAWLNVFLIAGELRVITIIAGLLALTVAALNIKDYFWFKEGPEPVDTGRREARPVQAHARGRHHRQHGADAGEHGAARDRGEFLRAAVHRGLPDGLHARADARAASSPGSTTRGSRPTT